MATGDPAEPTRTLDDAAQVHGHVSDVTGGQVAVGGRVFQIDAAQGSYVVINAEAEVEISRRPGPVLRPPPQFPGLVGRATERRRIRDALGSGLCVEVHGSGGIGKTALLRAAANDVLPASTPDGVVAIPARLGLADTLGYVFDTCYVGTRRVVPRHEELITALADLRLLLVVDDTSLTRDDVEALREAVPRSLLLLAATEQRVFEGVESVGLGGLGVEEGVDLIGAAVGRELTPREQDVAARVTEVLHGTPLELVRFASLVRGDEGDLVSVARGFGVDAQPEDLLVAVRRSVSAEEDDVLAALAAFDAPVGAGPVAAFTGRADAGVLLLDLCHRGLVQGDDLQGWRVRDHIAAPPEDRHRAATVLIEWVRRRSVPEEVAGEIPAIASVLRQAERDHRWVDVISLAAAAERPLALAGRWAAWRDTLEAGRGAARTVGDQASVRFFSHQLDVIATAEVDAPPHALVGASLGASGSGSGSGSHPRTAQRISEPHRDEPSPPPPPPPRRPWALVVAALLGLVVLAVFAVRAFTDDEPSVPTGDADATTQPTTETTDQQTTDGGAQQPSAAPNLWAFTLGSESAEVTVGQERTMTVRVWNEPLDIRAIGPSGPSTLTVSLSGEEVELLGGTPACAMDGNALECQVPEIAPDGKHNVTVTLIGRAVGEVDLFTVVEGQERPNTPRRLTVVDGRCEIPNVVGMNVDQAEAVLAEEGFSVERIGVEDGFASGLVIEQTPPPGERTQCGDTVTLRFSTIT
jgi:hypothetical protein